MYSLDAIKQLNLRNLKDEETRLQTNYEVQPDGDVWIRHNGILRILSAERSETEEFLASVKKGNAIEIITNVFKS